MKAKILVAGGAGYIGSHTSVSLLENAYDLVVVDDLSNSKAEAVERVAQITGRRPIFYQLDVCDRTALGEVFAREKPDAVIHFAGYKAVGESVAKPLDYYRNNLNSSLSLLECMAAHACHCLIFSSSATVYGVPDTVPIREDAPLSCTNPYGRTKLMSEEILRDAAVANPSLSVVLLRYFNPVGAHPSGLIGEDPRGIPNNLMPYIAQVAIGKLERLRIFGDDYPTHDGTGVRDYIHVQDLAEGHLAALRYAEGHKGVRAVNLGTGKGYSVLDLLHSFEKVNRLKIAYEIVGRRAGDVAACYADPALAKELLSWQASRSLEDMCRDSWNWQSKNPRGYGD